MFDQRLNQLSAQITQMTPQQRQQFAMLHKNDPILVSLTKFVNDSDQAAKTAMLAKQAPQMANQPKVVDQTIAAMGQPMQGPPITPPPNAKQQGVAGLPAPNLAGMPDGGIAGQPDPQQAPAPGPGMAAGGQVRRFDEGGFTNFSGDPIGGAFNDPYTVAPPTPPQPYRDPRIYKGARLSSPLDQERDAAMAKANAYNPAKDPSAQQGPPASAQMTDNQLARQRLETLIANPPSDPTAAGGAGGPGMKPGSGGGGLAALPGASVGMKMPPGYSDIDPKATYTSTLADLQSQDNPMQDKLDDLGEAQEDAAQAHIDSTKQRIADMGIAGADREKRLNARGQRIDDNYKENSATALLSAGLAMMAGTSPNAFANIGNGAQVGLKQFTEGKNKLDEARDKLDDAFGQLEDIRRNEQNMNSKDLQAAIDNKQQVIANHMKDVLQATQMKYGVDSQTASHIVDANIHQAAAKLGYLGTVQGAQIHGMYDLAGRQAMAGAEDRASQRSYAASIFGHQIYGGTADSNAMHGDARYSGIAAGAYARFGQEAIAALKVQGGLGMSPEQQNQFISDFIQKRAAESGMPQSGGASSAGAPAFRYGSDGRIVPNQ